jgi:hypothetical protein
LNALPDAPRGLGVRAACRVVLLPLVLLWALGANPLHARAASPQLTRAPYLTDVSQSTAIVNFATDTQTPAPVANWGGSCASLPNVVTATFVRSFVGSTTDYLWSARITGLSAGSTHCYQVIQGGVALGATTPFATAPGSGVTSYRFAVLGDFGGGTTDEAMVMSQIAANSPNFLMTVGDNAYQNGGQTDYGDLTSGNVFGSQYLPKIGGGTSIFAAHGNHGFSSYQAYLDNFPQNDVVSSSGGRFTAESYCCTAVAPGATTYASAWYAFTWGNARFYVLEAAWADANGAYTGDFQGHWNGVVAGCTPCGQELTWLQNDLSAHASTQLKFAFFHYPLYSDNSGEPTDTFLDGSSALEGLLASNNVGIAFTGHAHQYERNLPQISGSPLVSYVTGGGGGTPQPPSGAAGACGAGSAFDACQIDVNEFLRVDVNGNSVTVTPIDETGKAFDVQTYNFGPVTHTAPGAPTGVSATAGNASATVSWSAPINNGGDPITGYTVTSSRGGVTATTTGATAVTVAPLINGTTYTFTVTAHNLVGSGPASQPSNAVTPLASGVLGVTTGGYWLVASDGGIFPFGNAGGYGSTGAIQLNQPIVGMAATASGHGYWLVASDGGIFPFGDAVGYGSTGNIRLNKPIVAIAAVPHGRGYYMVASDGGIFPFGPDAVGYGSTGAVRLNQPIVGMAVTPDGHGYWLVASDGGIFPFGDAAGYGSTGGIHLNRPIVGMAPTASGHGYWLVASDGGIFPFGDAAGYGSTGGIRLNQPIVGLATTSDGGGYWLMASDGGIFPFGDAPGLGSTGGIRLNKPIVGMAGRA